MDLPPQNRLETRRQRRPCLLVGWNTVARRSSHSIEGDASVGRANVLLWACITRCPYLYVFGKVHYRSRPALASVVSFALRNLDANRCSQTRANLFASCFAGHAVPLAPMMAVTVTKNSEILITLPGYDPAGSKVRVELTNFLLWQKHVVGACPLSSVDHLPSVVCLIH